ncbi:MAG TPA: cation:proton antiporter, partial [Thermoanaerobaculia bacterium]|nr:cation:proton antiporter [Thermoanaerobaculia bacterium]
RVETFSSVLLLPLFFAFTGLRTQIGLLNDGWSWAVCAGLILVAVTGKLGGTLATARWTGMSWGDSFSLGALMNTRGMVELIVLNLGYDLGILSPRIFTMLVIMALATTFMTGPLLQLRHLVGSRETVMAAEGNGAKA